MTRNFAFPILVCWLMMSYAGCLTNEKELAFTGVWNVAEQNLLVGEDATSHVAVEVSGKRFRVTSRSEDVEITAVYDGRMLTEKKRPWPPSDYGSSERPTVTVEKKSDNAVHHRRFWVGLLDERGVPGGRVAGRDTVLYQAQGRHSDKTVTVQMWVDVETNIVLRRISTIFSTQLEQMISRRAEECEEIHYGPVGESAFGKP